MSLIKAATPYMVVSHDGKIKFYDLPQMIVSDLIQISVRKYLEFQSKKVEANKQQ